MAGATTIADERPKLRTPLLDVAGSIVFAATTLVILATANHGLVKLYRRFAGSEVVWAPLALGVIGAAVFWRARYADFTTILRASIRASAVGLLIYLLVEPPDFTLVNGWAAPAAGYVSHGWFVGVGLAALSIWRPAFLVPAALYTISTRHLVASIADLRLSVLDIRYMIDMALYMTVFGLAVVKVGPRIHPWLGSTDRQNEIVGVGFGLHLANYFWSGVAKLLIGPTPWYWIAHNATFNQVPYMIEAGISPLGQWPWLAQFSYDAFKFAIVPMNAFVVGAQLFSLICVFRRSWLKVASLIFDAFHLGIYFFGGLFFWPWIWNNVTIWWAARTMKVPLARHTQIACVATILLGAPALKLNEAAWLGWFDLADARLVYFQAVTKTGEAAKVPAAFFLSHSYAISHGYWGLVPLAGQYPATVQSSGYDTTVQKTSGTCPNPAVFPPGPLMTPDEQARRHASIQRFLIAHHAKMLRREATLGHLSFYFRSHHHPSNPFLYKDFNRLALRDVVGYRLVIESDCFGLKDGRPTKKVWARDVESFSVR